MIQRRRECLKSNHALLASYLDVFLLFSEERNYLYLIELTFTKKYFTQAENGQSRHYI